MTGAEGPVGNVRGRYIAMDDTSVVEVADASHNAKHVMLRQTCQRAFSPHFWVANPKGLAEGCSASLRGNIQIQPLTISARAHAAC